MRPKAQSDPLESKSREESGIAAARAAGCAAESFAEAMLARFDSQNKAIQRDAVERLADAAASGDRRCAAALRRALSSPNPRVRWAGGYALGRIEDASGADVLCEGLSSSDPDLRWASARMLARLGQISELTRDMLLRLASAADGDPVARRMALHSIRYLGARGQEILSVAEDAAHSAEKLVRLGTLSLLASLDDSSGRAAAVAIAMVECDPDSGVRRAAAVSMGKFGNHSAEAIETLARTAADRLDRALARAAECSLRRLGTMAMQATEILSEPRVREFVTAARIARLATAGAEGIPHNVPLCFWFDGERFYFAIDEKPKRARGTRLKRMRNIAGNPHVALLIDHYEEDWAALAYVLVHGVAQIVEEPKEYMLALRHLRDKYTQYRAMTLNPERNPIVRIDPERAHAWGARFASTTFAPAAAARR